MRVRAAEIGKLVAVLMVFVAIALSCGRARAEETAGAAARPAAGVGQNRVVLPAMAAGGMRSGEGIRVSGRGTERVSAAGQNADDECPDQSAPGKQAAVTARQ